MRNIVTRILMFSMLLLSALVVEAQCVNYSQYPYSAVSINTSNSSYRTISTCSWAGEYSVVTGATAGQTLRFKSSINSDYITVRAGGFNGPVQASGSSVLSFVNNYTGTLYVHWNTNASCGTSTTCRTTQVQCLSCNGSNNNDACNGAIPIACGQSLSGSTVGSSPDNAPSCNGFSVGTGGGVWYKFVGTGGFATASLCNSATTYDTKLHVYMGSCNNLLCVGGDDDGCSSPGLASSVTWCSTAGMTYYILVSGYGNATGNFNLSMDCSQPSINISPIAPQCVGNAPVALSASPAGGTWSGAGVVGSSFYPSIAGAGSHTLSYALCGSSASTTVVVNPPATNDDCANAIAISCGNTYAGSTVCASPDAGLNFCGTSGGTANGVWYALQGDGAQYRLSTCNPGTNFDTKLHVFEGSCGQMSCVTGNDDYYSTPYSCSLSGLRSYVEFCTEQGKTYYVLVSGFSTSNGAFELSVNCNNPLSIEAGDCQTRFVGYEGPGAPDDTLYLCPTITGGDGNYSVSISPAAAYRCANGCFAVAPTSSTVYTITVSDGNGCVASDQVEVQYIDLQAACGSNGQPKVQICHVPPGNPANAHNICISPNAVPAHLVGGPGHGTCYLGPCDNPCNATNEACDALSCSGGTFTLSISGSGFLDETSWTFGGSSGGPYSYGSSNVSTVTIGSNDPSDFCIETQGSFNDNEVNYVISCSSGIIASGTLLGGQSTCLADLCCNGGFSTIKAQQGLPYAGSQGIIAFPNPMGSRGSLRFRTAVAGEASISLFALDGRLIASLYQGRMEAGEQKEIEFERGQLSAGTYLYRYVRPDGQMVRGKWVAQ